MRIRIDEELGEDEKRDGEEDEDQDDECWAKLHFSTVFLVFQDQRRASKSLWLKRIICDPPFRIRGVLTIVLRHTKHTHGRTKKLALLQSDTSRSGLPPAAALGKDCLLNMQSRILKKSELELPLFFVFLHSYCNSPSKKTSQIAIL